VILVNGAPREAAPGLTVLGLVRALGLDPARVAVELNGSVVARDAFAATPVLDGFKAEIVHFVGGG
jgi:thiamine biosynthesis protein ThiS